MQIDNCPTCVGFVFRHFGLEELLLSTAMFRPRFGMFVQNFFFFFSFFAVDNSTMQFNLFTHFVLCYRTLFSFSLCFFYLLLSPLHQIPPVVPYS